MLVATDGPQELHVIVNSVQFFFPSDTSKHSYSFQLIQWSLSLFTNLFLRYSSDKSSVHVHLSDAPQFSAHYLPLKTTLRFLFVQPFGDTAPASSFFSLLLVPMFLSSTTLKYLFLLSISFITWFSDVKKMDGKLSRRASVAVLQKKVPQNLNLTNQANNKNSWKKWLAAGCPRTQRKTQKKTQTQAELAKNN